MAEQLTSSPLYVNSVVTIQNKRSGTFLELNDGDSENGTAAQGWDRSEGAASFNQMWLVEQGSIPDFVRLRNLKSGTYLELADTTVSNGTAARGWELRIDQPGLEVAQEWVLYHFEKKKFLHIINASTMTALDLNNGSNTNGTKVQGWIPKPKPNDNQLWTVTRVSRSGTEIQALIDEKHLFKASSQRPLTTPYITLPDKVRKDIYAKVAVDPTHVRDGIFESSDFASIVKSAVSVWGRNNLKADHFAILFGTMHGTSTDKKSRAFNFYLSQDFTGIVFFEPTVGSEKDEPWGHSTEAVGLF